MANDDDTALAATPPIDSGKEGSSHGAAGPVRSAATPAPILLSRPETKNALLVTEGPGPRRATRHVYSHTDVLRNELGRASFAHMFKCEETGVVRRWGVEAA
jgi:hypothetical protein